MDLTPSRDMDPSHPLDHHPLADGKISLRALVDLRVVLATEASHRALVDMDVEMALGHLEVGVTTLLVASGAMASDTRSKYYLFFFGNHGLLSDHASVFW